MEASRCRAGEGFLQTDQLLDRIEVQFLQEGEAQAAAVAVLVEEGAQPLRIPAAHDGAVGVQLLLGCRGGGGPGGRGPADAAAVLEQEGLRRQVRQALERHHFGKRLTGGQQGGDAELAQLTQGLARRRSLAWLLQQGVVHIAHHPPGHCAAACSCGGP
jgi:hypothetical protein